MSGARRASQQDGAWRMAVAAELQQAGLANRAEEIENCHSIWVGGHPYRCRRAYCPTCLRFRIWCLARDDEERLKGRCHGILTTVATKPVVAITAPAWYRAVHGYRKLWLPESESFLWVIVSDDPKEVRHYLGTPLRRAALSNLQWIYRRVVDELLSLGPTVAVSRVMLRKRARNFEATGIFRTKLKRKRRVPVARL